MNSNIVTLPTKYERFADGFIRLVTNIANIQKKTPDEILDEIHSGIYEGKQTPIHNVYLVIEADDDMSEYVMDKLGLLPK